MSVVVGAPLGETTATMTATKLVLDENPADRFARAQGAIEAALGVIAGVRAKTRNPSLDQRLAEVCGSIGVVFDVLEGLQSDIAALVEVLPDTIEIEIAGPASGGKPAPDGRAAAAAPPQTDSAGSPIQREPVEDDGAGADDEQHQERDASPAMLVLPSFDDGRDSGPAEEAGGKFKRTDEQDAIVFSNDNVLGINAGAGSGKTSTLIEYANYRDRTRFLYLAFNRAIADEAQRKFGKNVVAKTSHSLAYGRFGRDYGQKLGNPRARDVQELLQSRMRMPVHGNADEYVFAQAALNRVRDFFAEGSLNPEIVDQDGVIQMPSGVEVDGSEIGNAARLLWEAMQDKSNMAIRLPHDGYLKLWQLSKPDLSRLCDTLLLDEAQDEPLCAVGGERTTHRPGARWRQAPEHLSIPGRDERDGEDSWRQDLLPDQEFPLRAERGIRGELDPRGLLQRAHAAGGGWAQGSGGRPDSGPSVPHQRRALRRGCGVAGRERPA